LTAWRIPRKISDDLKDEKLKRAVILNHGLLDNSYTFMANPNDNVLPFLLANQG
jgi:hypothetical protein